MRNIVLKFSFHSNGDEFYNRVYPGEGLRPDSTALRDYQEAAYFGKWAGPAQNASKRVPLAHTS